jgi:hypothetical protein
VSRVDPNETHDEAWLLARERGEAATHPDAERARGYERLAQALAQPPSREPPADFEAKLFAALDRVDRARGEAAVMPERTGPVSGEAAALERTGLASGEAAALERIGPVSGEAAALERDEPAPVEVVAPARDERPLLRRLRFAALYPLAAAAIALLAFRATRPADEPPTLVLDIIASEPMRGEAPSDAGLAARGDRLRLRAHFAKAGELRVYRDERELVLRCPGEAACVEGPEGAGRAVRGEVTLRAPGQYRALLMTGASVPVPTGHFDADWRAAEASGATIVTAPPLTVR